ncbi:MAG: glycosyltransferase [Actinomycetota bacterium]|nr:glycosyltransferase [Actinomycetota bacterium]
MEIHQILVAAAEGDAITQMALSIRDALRQVTSSEIYAFHTPQRAFAGIKPLRRLPASGRRERLLIYHSSIGEPQVTRVIADMSDPLVLVYHNITPSSWFKPWDSQFAALLEWGRREVAQLRERVVLPIAVSRFNALELEEMGYADVVVVPAGAHPGRLLDMPGEEIDDPNISPVILAVGQILPHKRIELLVQMAAVLEHYAGLKARVAVVGGSPVESYGNAVAGYVRRSGTSMVRLTGRVSDGELATLYRRADVYVTASEHEGLCLPPLEAMAFGVPVLARRHAALPETLGGAALLLDPDSGPVEMAEGAYELLHNHSFADVLRERGKARLTEFEPAHTTAAFLDALAPVL